MEPHRNLRSCWWKARVKCEHFPNEFIPNNTMSALYSYFLAISSVLKHIFFRSISCCIRDHKVKSHVFISPKYKTISCILPVESLEFSGDSFCKLNVKCNFMGKFIKANPNRAPEKVQINAQCLILPHMTGLGCTISAKEQPDSIWDGRK